MQGIYTFLIRLYGLGMRLAALFHPKARKWVTGRTRLSEDLASLSAVDRVKNPVIWFHVSSLGEFEQGRPVMEALKKMWPRKTILLTFFSPSGYEIRKDDPTASLVVYLPLDTPANVNRFLDLAAPECVIFVKYDFWFNFIREIHRRKIPLLYISALFRKDQHFFRWYGRWFRDHLKMVEHFFVQDQKSADLLHAAGLTHVTVSGDTRFDRVYEIAAHAEPLPKAEIFCRGSRVFIAGSSWEPDEAVILPLIRNDHPEMKFIIAPHDPSAMRIREILGKLDCPAVLWSELDEHVPAPANVLIIDRIGILSRLYQYAIIAFIGGGFGSGLHNIQEPVTFGVPVIFGPFYQKFREAGELIGYGGAFSIRTTGEMETILHRLLQNPDEYQRVSSICRNYVEENRGATDKILDYLKGILYQ